MAITLAQLCSNCESRYSMRLIAGKKGLGNMVRWVHIVEDMEISSFLHSNELIFTTGIGCADGSGLLRFVKNLKSHNAAGIAVNLGPHISKVPEEVIKFCSKESFPLFTLPWDTYIIDVTYDFCRRIIDSEKSEKSAADDFRSIINHTGDVRTLRVELENLGFSIMNTYMVMIVAFFRNEKNVTALTVESNHIRIWNIAARSRYPSVMFVQDGYLVIICQKDSEEPEKHIAEYLKRSVGDSDIKLVAGVSSTVRGYENIEALFREAQAAYKTAFVRGAEMLCYDDIGLNKLLFAVDNKEVLSGFVYEYLGRIYEYDEKNGTDFAGLLRQYIESNAAVKVIAEENGLHRNTVNQRINQIKELFSLTLSGEERVNIMLAFHIKDILDCI